MELKKTYLFVILIILLFSLSELSVANEPAENKRGLCDAWFSKDGINWQNTTTRTSLYLGQTFYLKVLVKAKIDLKFLRYQLTCYGPPYDFELIKQARDLPENAIILQESIGRSIINIAFEDVKAGEEYIQVWKLCVKPNSSFVNGTTPINLDSFFFNGNDEENMLFTAVSVSIIDELWEEYQKESQIKSDDNQSGEDIFKLSVFEILILIHGLSLILSVNYKKVPFCYFRR